MAYLIDFLNSLSPAFVWAILFLLCYTSIVMTFRYFGKIGLYAYIIVAVICANIQVLKLVQFEVFPDPIALGTTLFTSTFLCTDILYECYGQKAAQKGVMLGFFGFLLFTLFMTLTLGFKPLTSTDQHLLWALDMHNHMLEIFKPTPTLFIAGMFSYLLSQHLDIFIYGALKKITSDRFLWLRNNIASIFSCLLDSFVFSFLAFYVLAEHKIPLHSLLMTYVLGSFLLRSVIAILDTPFLYAALYFKPKEENNVPI
ncbi:MAG: queuosine precursor transporter [Alphaproteobacteria bacterium]|nr:queuosine precursor transporter [Alphaproteobacteria bacterium]